MELLQTSFRCSTNVRNLEDTMKFAAKPSPAIPKLHELFECDHETGALRNGMSRANDKVKAGSVATFMMNTGVVSKRRHLAHRTAWAVHHGEDPVGSIVDHINRDKMDNGIENLCLANYSQSSCNRGVRKDNKSGVSGVCWLKSERKWCTEISVAGKTHSKRCEDLNHAIAAR